MRLRAWVGAVVWGIAALVGASGGRAANRTLDGSGNHTGPGRTTWGAAATDVIRIGYPADYPDEFGDAIYGSTSSPAWPNARDVSNAISAQSAPKYNDRLMSDWVVQWGQFLTHDMDLTEAGSAYNVLSTGATGDFRIPITSANDPLGPNPISFNRSRFNPTTGTSATIAVPGGPGRPNWREQVNSVTSYIDASNVYGSDATRAAALRTFSDGKLVTTAGGLLPGLNTAGLTNDDPFGLGAAQFLAGDARANEQVGLTSTHALFVREHNRLAGLLKANNPAFTDETIYQTARKIVGAEMQAITYKEFLPALMGTSAPTPDAYVFNNTLDPSITNSFATAFFRFGHSMQSSSIQLVGNDGLTDGSLSLRNSFFNPALLKDSPEIVDSVLKGLGSQVAQENDVLIVDDLRNFLFGPPGAGGMDLGALDIQRGRDHGLLDFNAFRPAYGLTLLPSINQLTTDVALRAKLTSIYGNINSIDAFIGCLAEDHVTGTSVGRMLRASLIDQFTRLRDGDRFFYTGDADLQTSTVTSVINLDTVTLGDLIRLNTGITSLQSNVFFTFMESDFNEDGAVNAADLAIWRTSVGVSADGDADRDGDTDGSDLLVWQRQEGYVRVSAEGATALVPEPGAGVLAAWLVAATCGGRGGLSAGARARARRP
jgi:peroxidase